MAISFEGESASHEAAHLQVCIVWCWLGFNSRNSLDSDFRTRTFRRAGGGVGRPVARSGACHVSVLWEPAAVELAL